MDVNEWIKQPEVAGTVGGILGWLNAPGGTLREQAFNLLAGLSASAYLAPYLAEKAGLESPTGRIAFAFMTGLVGMNILAKMVRAAKSFDWGAFLPKGGKS